MLGAALIPNARQASVVGSALLIGHQLLGDAGHVMYDVHDRTLRQSVAPSEMLARLDAGIRTLGQSATLIGALAGGGLAAALGHGRRWHCRLRSSPSRRSSRGVAGQTQELARSELRPIRLDRPPERRGGAAVQSRVSMRDGEPARAGGRG
jgi:hypothetical protein